MDINSIMEALKKLEPEGHDVIVSLVLYSNGVGWISYDGEEISTFEHVEDLQKAFEFAHTKVDDDILYE